MSSTSEIFDTLSKSRVLVVVANQGFLRELREQGDCYEQIRMARALKKPAVLLLVKELTAPEQEEARQSLNGLEVLAELPYDESKPAGQVAREIHEILKGRL